jgi:hypothetical protein
LDKYADKIVDILIIEGKKTVGDQVKSDVLSFANFIYSDNYFLTLFDLWLRVTKYEIPTIFISQKFILQTNYEKHEFIAYGNREDNFIFIIVPGLRPEHIPNYKIIQTNDKDITISLNKLNDKCFERINTEFESKIYIEEYLNTFMKPLKTEYKKKKPIEIENKIKLEEETIKKSKKMKKQHKIIVEDSDSNLIEYVPQQNITKRKLVLKGNNGTKKNKKKIIIENSTE